MHVTQNNGLAWFHVFFVMFCQTSGNIVKSQKSSNFALLDIIMLLRKEFLLHPSMNLDGMVLTEVFGRDTKMSMYMYRNAYQWENQNIFWHWYIQVQTLENKLTHSNVPIYWLVHFLILVLLNVGTCLKPQDIRHWYLIEELMYQYWLKPFVD